MSYRFQVRRSESPLFRGSFTNRRPGISCRGNSRERREVSFLPTRQAAQPEAAGRQRGQPGPSSPEPARPSSPGLVARFRQGRPLRGPPNSLTAVPAPGRLQPPPAPPARSSFCPQRTCRRFGLCFQTCQRCRTISFAHNQ